MYKTGLALLAQRTFVASNGSLGRKGAQKNSLFWFYMQCSAALSAGVKNNVLPLQSPIDGSHLSRGSNEESNETSRARRARIKRAKRKQPGRKQGGQTPLLPLSPFCL